MWTPRSARRPGCSSARSSTLAGLFGRPRDHRLDAGPARRDARSMRGRLAAAVREVARDELGEHVRNHGVPLLFEPLNRYETNQANTLADGVRAARVAVDDERPRLLADLFHMNIEDADLAASIRAAGTQAIGHVHFVDSNSPGLRGWGITSTRRPIAAAARRHRLRSLPVRGGAAAPDLGRRGDSRRSRRFAGGSDDRSLARGGKFSKGIARDSTCYSDRGSCVTIHRKLKCPSFRAFGLTIAGTNEVPCMLRHRLLHPDDQRRPRPLRPPRQDPDRRRQLPRLDQLRPQRRARLPEPDARHHHLARRH